MSARLSDLLHQRFGEAEDTPPELDGNPALARMAGRGSCRSFRPEPPDAAMLRSIAAVALAAPSKSDLQQRDIVIVSDPGQLARLKALLAGQAWIEGAPALLVFCANNRRQRQLHELWGRPFANDHFDALFNAAVDAGIALSAFVTAGEAAGLGCCPISTIRNRAAEVSALLGLPDHVFPVAGLAVGRPATEPTISLRLPLSATVHADRYTEPDFAQVIGDYDAARAAQTADMPQRQQERFGRADPYTWSDDKTRQYARPERAEFGAFLRDKGFRMD